MNRSVLLIILISARSIAFGQSNLHGDYSGSTILIDSVEHLVKLNLKPDNTYTMSSIYLNSSGKWKTAHNKIKLKPNFFKAGRFILDNETIKLDIDNDKLIWKSRANKKNAERKLNKSSGEKITIKVKESDSITFYKMVQ